MAESSLSAVDLFCGAGGLSTGLEWAGYDIHWAIDSDTKAVKTYEENHLDVEIATADISNVLPPKLNIEGDLDLVAGGPPCSTFSKVGQAKLNSLEDYDPSEDSRHQLWQDFRRFVVHYEPRVFLMENVRGMAREKNDDGEVVLSIISNKMPQLGYRVRSQIVDAADYGVPQHRNRLFIIGNRMELRNPDLENWKTHRESRRREERQARLLTEEMTPKYQQSLGDFLSAEDESQTDSWNRSTPRQPHVTVGEAILDLPPLSPVGDRISGEETYPPVCAEHYEIPAVTEYQSWTRNIPEHQEWKEMPLHNHDARFHNMTDLSIYKLLGPATDDNRQYTR